MNPALLIIDVQRGIDEAEHWGGNRNNPEAEGNIKLLVQEWRKKNLPVFVIQHLSSSPESPFFAGKPGVDLKDFIEVREGDEAVFKKHTNAFIETSLDERLRKLRVREVVIVGFVTNNSVEATARMAAELGYKTTVVSDATACFNKKGVDGSVYPSELVHQISLSNLHGEYAEIKTTWQILFGVHEVTAH